jgi:CDP-4-dehydro-6-deoxyglucose reductase
MLMSTTVRILPSGREYVSEGNSNLLEAGLRSGLALGYGCSNGNCGRCLAKIISGDVQKVRHSDYPISDEKKASGHVLMCCNAALTDVVLEASEARDSSDIPRQEITARVRSIEIVNNDVALIHLKTPRTNRLRFLAGQHVLLGINKIPAANHSVSSCPCDDRNLHFQIPRLSGDEFSAHIFSQLGIGDPIEITGPTGNFVLNENSSHPLVFIAGRTGFAPIRSLIEHAMALEFTGAIRLVWIADNKKDRYLDNLCRSWEDALDNFSYIPVDADLRANAADTGSIIGRLNIKPGDLAGYDFYIAGNASLVDSCRKTLINSGLPTKQLMLDQIEHD